MICIDCGGDAGKRFRRCEPCRDARVHQKTHEAGNKRNEILLAKLRDHPNLCVEHLCGNKRHGDTSRCDFHLQYRRDKAKVQREKYHGKVAEIEEDYIVPAEPWEPKPKPKPTMTEKQRGQWIKDGEDRLMESRRKLDPSLLFQRMTRGSAL